MTEYNIFDPKMNFSKIAKDLEKGIDDYVIITKNNKPLLKVTLLSKDKVNKRVGGAKGLFTVPDNSNDIDISNLFEGEIFPE